MFNASIACRLHSLTETLKSPGLIAIVSSGVRGYFKESFVLLFIRTAITISLFLVLPTKKHLLYTNAKKYELFSSGTYFEVN